MKKYFLILALFISVSGFSQRIGTYWKVDSLNDAMGKNFRNPANYPLVYVYETGKYYQLTDTITSTQTMAQAIAGGWCYGLTPLRSTATTITAPKPITVGSATDTIFGYTWSRDGKKWKISLNNSGGLYTVTVTP